MNNETLPVYHTSVNFTSVCAAADFEYCGEGDYILKGGSKLPLMIDGHGSQTNHSGTTIFVPGHFSVKIPNGSDDYKVAEMLKGAKIMHAALES